MSSHLAHSDLSSPAEMGADGRHVREALGLADRWSRAARAAVAPAPSLAFDDQPTDRPKREVTVSEAASRLAAAIYGD